MQLLDRALAARPNYALAWAFSGVVCCWLGDGPTAILRTERGRRLSPMGSFAFLHEDFHALAHYIQGDFAAAVASAQRAVALNPRHAPSYRTLIVSLVAAGRLDEACAAAQNLLEIEPRFALDAFAARTPLRGAIRDAFVERLRAAGLPG
jgi:tetratricopeptide (TPR) repeat protein